ncbi:MAG TPA: hypothetical protein VF075_12010 [Pyrinomonadaceae bacterium]
MRSNSNVTRARRKKFCDRCVAEIGVERVCSRDAIDLSTALIVLVDGEKNISTLQ